MPWKESSIVDQRKEFVLKACSETVDFSELCKEYGISRKTGYKWKKRFIEEGLVGLTDQSRRPQRHPSELGEDVVCKIIRLKMNHLKWGPRKIRIVFARTFPALDLPSDSTFKRVLDKVGLVEHRKRRKPAETGRISNQVQPTHPNHVWTTDFKGWWWTGDRCRFEPLTIRDGYSRFLLCAKALENNRTDSVKRAFAEVFSTYGLPKIIRSDNGSPFAANRSPLGISRLSAWWLALGIDLDRIDPGRPDQNGGHERMHRDIAMEIECESESDILAQQAVLDTWRNTYNHERPHEAIDMRVPHDLYQNSKTAFDDGKLVIEYPLEYISRKVSSKGVIAFRGTHINVSKSLAGWHVALRHESQSNVYGLWFCSLRLGQIDLQTNKFCSTQPTKKD